MRACGGGWEVGVSWAVLFFVVSDFGPAVVHGPRRTAASAETSAGRGRTGPHRPEGSDHSTFERRTSYHMPVQLHLPALREVRHRHCDIALVWSTCRGRHRTAARKRMIDATTPETNASPHPPAGQRLRDLYTEECAWRSGELGPLTMPDADEEPTFLPRVDETAQLARQHRWERTLVEVRKLPRCELTVSETLDLDIYVQQLETLVKAQECRMWERPVNADSAFWRNLTFGALRQHLP